MMGPANCQQRPGAHYRRNALLALSTALLLAACGGSDNVRPGARQQSVAHAWPSVQPSDPAKANAVLMRAISLVGTPYRYGGNTPEGGFDCSGLVHYVFGRVAAGSPAARRLPRSTAQWAAASAPVDEARLQRGDLVFFNTSGAPFSHMGIFVGAGQFVHAPSSGGTVRKDAVDGRYFGPRYLGGRSVFSG